MGQEQNSIRAIIVATEGHVNFATGTCSPMIPLVDRPFLQHVVECLVDRGIKQIDFLVNDHAHAVESHFGDGKRWGAEFEYHLVRDVDHPYERLASLDLGADPFLLIQGDRLQPEKWSEVIQRNDPVVFTWDGIPDGEVDGEVDGEGDGEGDGEVDSLAGACWIPLTFLDGSLLSKNRAEFERELVRVARERGCQQSVACPLSAESFAALLESQGRVLNREFPELIRFSGNTQENVWIGRNVYMKTIGSKFEPPFFIGSNCTIEGETSVGPNVVICDGAYINPKCEISNALILPDSLVGEGLAIDGCVLDRHQLFHVQHNVAVSVADDLLFGTTQVSLLGGSTLRNLVSRTAAIIGLVVLSPLLLLMALVRLIVRGRAFETEKMVRLPVGDSDQQVRTFTRYRFTTAKGAGDSNWKHFWLDVLPGLINIARGELGWVGVAPLTPDEFDRLPEDIREEYARSSAGLINESTVLYGQCGSFDERLMAEIYYAVAVRSLVSRIKLVCAYFYSVLFGPRARRADQSF